MTLDLDRWERDGFLVVPGFVDGPKCDAMILPHFSCANRSPRSRHAYAIHFVDDACRWSEDNWLRPS